MRQKQISEYKKSAQARQTYILLRIDSKAEIRDEYFLRVDNHDTG